MREKNLYKVFRNKNNTKQIEVEYYDMSEFPFEYREIYTVIPSKNYRRNVDKMELVEQVLAGQDSDYDIMPFSAYIHSGIALKPMPSNNSAEPFGYFLYKKAACSDEEFTDMLELLSAYYNGETYAAFLYNIETCKCCNHEDMTFMECTPDLFDNDTTLENLINCFELNGEQTGNWIEIQQQ